MLGTLHDGLANAVAIFSLLLALLGFYRYARGEGVSPDYYGALLIAEALIVVEALLGALLFGAGARPVRLGMHVLYGIVAVISFPAFYAFVRGRDGRQEMLLWALMALFVFGIALRALVVAG